MMGQIGNYIGDGLMWLVEKGVSGLIYMGGNFCRFMVTECEGTFLIFALVGGLIYVGGGNKVGMKMIRVALGSYVVMGFVGVFF